MKAKEFIIELKKESKPRNFVAKNAKMGGAGQHKDKKKAEKQGDVKHKKDFAMESSLKGKDDLQAKRKALQDLSMNKDVDQKHVQQRKLDLEKEAKEKGISEAEKKGLYYYVNKRKKAGTSRPASSPKAPTAQAWKDAAKTAKKEGVAEGDKYPFAGAKVGQKAGKAGQLKGTDPKGYPKGKLVGGG